MKTVYVLGLRIKTCRLPACIHDGSRDGRVDVNTKQVSRDGRSYQGNFGASPDIEDVITDLDDIITSLEGAKETADRKRRTIATHRRSELAEVMLQSFLETYTNPPRPYDQFAKNIVQRGDVIIAFNYDDSLERELKRADKGDVSQGYGFQIGDIEKASPRRVLKLHSSINWLVSIFNGATSEGRICS